jgi:hypothetical protein
MIYLIFEFDLFNCLIDVSAYTNKREFEAHVKVCDKVMGHPNDVENTYRYDTKIVRWHSVKAKLCNSINETYSGIEATLQLLEELEEE